MIQIIDLLAYIEVQSNEKDMVRPALERAREDIKNAGVDVIESSMEDVTKHKDAYSGVLEMEMRTDIKHYVTMAMIYAPTSIDILAGDLLLDKREFLETLGDVSNLMRKLMEDLDMAFNVVPQVIERKFDEEKEYIPLTIFCEVKGEEEKIKEQAELVFADSRAFIDKMKIRKSEGGDMLGIVGLFPDLESVFETTAKMTPVAFSTDEEEIAFSMRDVQVIGMSLASLTSEVATKKVSMSF